MQTSNADWITTKELAEIKGVSERAVRKAISSLKIFNYLCWYKIVCYKLFFTSLIKNTCKLQIYYNFLKLYVNFSQTKCYFTKGF